MTIFITLTHVHYYLLFNFIFDHHVQIDCVIKVLNQINNISVQFEIPGRMFPSPTEKVPQYCG